MCQPQPDTSGDWAVYEFWILLAVTVFFEILDLLNKKKTLSHKSQWMFRHFKWFRYVLWGILAFLAVHLTIGV